MRTRHPIGSPRRSNWALLVALSVSGGCFETPDLNGRACDAENRCPTLYLCDLASHKCFDPRRMPRPGDETSDVAGIAKQDFVSAAGIVSVPIDLRTTKIEALTRSAKEESFSTYEGSGTFDGRFVVPSVTGQEVYARLNNTFSISSARALDFSFFTLGRPDFESTDGRATRFTMMLSNIKPWKETDSLHIVTPNIGAFNYFIQVGFVPVTRGATTLSATFDYNALPTPRLPRASRGDVSYVTQLSDATSSAGQVYSVLARALEVTELELVAGQATSIAGRLADVEPNLSVDLRFCGARLAALAAEVHPRATETLAGMGGFVNPFDADAIWNAPRLFLFTSAIPSADIELGTLRFGNPYPSNWQAYGQLAATYRLDPPVPGTGPTRTESVFVSLPLASLTSACAAILGPPRNPKINGLDAYATNAQVSETPTLSWEAPSVGQATIYEVSVERLEGTTIPTTIATFLTASEEMVVPPGLLAPGGTYTARIAAEASTTSAEERLRSPRKRGLYFSRAATLLGGFSP